ncbi:MAG: hypothetical protein ACJAYC_000195 [Halieaceae bacterium]|jgi:hypothetical protein
MDYLRLAISLIIPWLGGYLWLAVITQRLNPGKPNTPLLIGYGLFLGYGGLQGIVLASNALFNTVQFWPILGFVGLLVAVGGAVLAKTRIPAAPDTELAAAHSDSNFAKALFWIFAAWATLHLLFVAIEILHRPVFPWDAWLSWMYRAKAWFYSGHIFVLDNPTDWLLGSGHAMYNAAGNHYPTFSPVLALWAATALGHWSETLINLPVLLCGIALGLALYGQCREYGIARWLSALSAYMLLSLPLLGAHLALAGQSDIWMAGFTGLGFIALLHGLIRNNRFQVLLGLGMAAMGIATKMEGGVWFLAALLTLTATKHTGLVLGGLALVICLVAVCWLTGVTYLELPLIGGIGFTDGRLHIPLMGSHSLQNFELWDDYQANFFESGTWHLLWTCIVLAAISLCFTPGGLLRRTTLIFYSVVLAAQLIVFKGTASGQWAEDWTAINRLPLHFSPALIFSLAILVQAFLERRKTSSAARTSFHTPIMGLFIALAGATAYLVLAYPATTAKPHSFTAQQMRIMAGGGRVAGEVGIIESYQNNIAILSSGPVRLKADKLGLLKLETAEANSGHAQFFWRNGSGPEDLHSTGIPGWGEGWVNLGDLPQWQGQITEIGVIFYAKDEKPAMFHRITVSPYSLPLHIRKLAHDWFETSRWSQKSVHWIAAGSGTSSVPLPIWMSAWLLITLLLVAILTRRTKGAYTSALLCAVIAWMVLDLRWTANGVAQAAETMRTYPLVTATYLEFGDDKHTRQLIEQARPNIEGINQRTVIMAENPRMRFEILRAKYHALPTATQAHEGPIQSAPIHIADYVLVLKQRHAETSHEPATPAAYAKIINKQNKLLATPVWNNEDGFLLQISPKPVTALQNN